MRRVISLGVGLAMFLVAGAAFAQQDDPEEKFYDFDPKNIEGGGEDPAGTHVDPRGEENFDPLLVLEKKSFLDEVQASTNDL